MISCLNWEEPPSDPASQKDPTTPFLLSCALLMLNTNAGTCLIRFASQARSGAFTILGLAGKGWGMAGGTAIQP